MAKPKRMGAFNALDELLPGPPGPLRSGLERARHAVRPKRPRPKRMGPYNALDDLMPGPASAGSGLDWSPQPDASWPEWLLPSQASRGAAGRTRAADPDVETVDALDDLLPGPPARELPAKVRASFQLPPEVLEAVRDATAHLSGPPLRMTMTALAERALRAEVERLAEEHNQGRPFPRRGRPGQRGR
jgi:hypothetical protein